ncbi:MAG: TatD family hydrolase [Nanoarchaeota archaeon]|nr:TatD family hydrolase [Nanoarchaeota archaeon]
MYIDVHCHLDICKDIDKIIEEVRKKKIGIIISNGVKPSVNRKILELAKKYKEVKCSMGIYPIDALALSDGEIDEEIKFIRKNKDKVTAIGEVGIDYKEDSENWDRQKKIFRKFINLSIELNKPIIVHSRKAEKECIEILEELNAKKVVMHCFSGKFSLIERISRNGWFLSIPGNVNHSEQFQNIAKKIDIKNLLCETDAPYLHPLKERDNTPVNVIYSYKKIAELKNMKIKDVEKAIEKNYYRLFS